MAGVGSPAPLRVVVIEEAEDLCLLLRFALALEPGVEVVDAAPAVELATAYEADVVLVDHHMTTSRRHATLEAIHAKWPQAGIVLAGSRLDPEQVAEAQAAGVGAFVQTRGDVSEAASAIRTAAATRPR